MKNLIGFAPSIALRNRFFTVLSFFLAISAMGVRAVHAQTYTISGAVSGFTIGSGATSYLYLYDNGIREPPINEDGVFSFTSTTAAYNITATAPTGETCMVANGTGTAPPPTTWPPVTNVWVSCQQNGAPSPGSNWTKLSNKPLDANGNPQWVDAMLLLSDGSVMANVFATTQWYRLTPASDGTYKNGTWAAMPNSNCPHGDFASQVLPDGRVFIAGGEAPAPSGVPGCAQSGQSGTGVDTELYDPSTNSWTKFLVTANGQTVNPADPPTSLINPNNPTLPAYNSICGTQAFLDMVSESLPGGSVLMAPVCPMSCGDTLIFNPSLYNPGTPGSGWSSAGTLANIGTPASSAYTCNQQEDTWVKLQDGSVLTADPPLSPTAQTQTSERYVPSLQKWVADTSLSFRLYDTQFGWSGNGETGPGFLLSNGSVFFVGGSSYSGTYTPSHLAPRPRPPVPSTWIQGDLWATTNPSAGPNGPATGGRALSADDVPGAMMANGKILLALNFAATAQDVTPTPYFFYEYDPTTPPGTYTEVAGPGNWAPVGPWADCGGVNITMLDLPDGTVLMESGCDRSQLYVYASPSGSPLPQGKPTVLSVAPTGSVYGTFIVTGTGFNGISEGASYGDDAQMASNYPLVRLADKSGHVSYARSFNWSSAGPMNGTAPGTTYFTLPANIIGAPQQWYTLQVVVNGNASTGTQFFAGLPPMKCPPSCHNGCIYTPPNNENPPVLVCKPSPLPQ